MFAVLLLFTATPIVARSGSLPGLALHRSHRHAKHPRAAIATGGTSEFPPVAGSCAPPWRRGRTMVASFGSSYRTVGSTSCSSSSSTRRRRRSSSGAGTALLLRGGAKKIKTKKKAKDDDSDDDSNCGSDDEDDEDVDWDALDNLDDDDDATMADFEGEDTLMRRLKSAVERTPPITQGFLSLSILVTALAMLLNGNQYPKFLLLDWQRVFARGELWRLFTAFLYFGPFDISFALTIQFVWQYMSQLEKVHHKEPEQFVMMWLTGATFLLAAFGLSNIPTANVSEELRLFVRSFVRSFCCFLPVFFPCWHQL